ncbi:MAG: hypothetical protein M1819_003536, partial [Sarea resinae]
MSQTIRLATLPLELCRWLRSEKRTKVHPKPLGWLQTAEAQESLKLDSDEALQVDQVLAFSQALIFDPLLVDPFDSALVYFLAVLSIDPLTKRLHTATSYSYQLARVVYCMQVIRVKVLLPAAAQERQGRAKQKRFLGQRKIFLADGSLTLISTMISLLAYANTGWEPGL